MPSLPIATGQYGSAEMRSIFDEENRLQKWLDVEAAIAQAQAAVGDIPKEAADEIARNANTKTVTLARTTAIENEPRPNLIPILTPLPKPAPVHSKQSSN